MNRAYHPLKGSIHVGVVLLAARLDIAAGGAVATTSVANFGDQTVGTQGWTLTTTGSYKLALSERIVGPGIVVITLEKGTAEDLDAELILNSMATSTQAITFRTVLSSNGTAVAPTNACKMHVVVYAVDSGGN